MPPRANSGKQPGYESCDDEFSSISPSSPIRRKNTAFSSESSTYDGSNLDRQDCRDFLGYAGPPPTNLPGPPPRKSAPRPPALETSFPSSNAGHRQPPGTSYGPTKGPLFPTTAVSPRGSEYNAPGRPGRSSSNAEWAGGQTRAVSPRGGKRRVGPEDTARPSTSYGPMDPDPYRAKHAYPPQNTRPAPSSGGGTSYSPTDPRRDSGRGPGGQADGRKASASSAQPAYHSRAASIASSSSATGPPDTGRDRRYSNVQRPMTRDSEYDQDGIRRASAPVAPGLMRPPQGLPTRSRPVPGQSSHGTSGNSANKGSGYSSPNQPPCSPRVDALRGKRGSDPDAGNYFESESGGGGDRRRSSQISPATLQVPPSPGLRERERTPYLRSGSRSPSVASDATARPGTAGGPKHHNRKPSSGQRFVTTYPEIDPAVDMALTKTRLNNARDWRDYMLSRIDRKTDKLRDDLLDIYKTDGDVQRRREYWKWGKKEAEARFEKLTKGLGETFAESTKDAILDQYEGLKKDPGIPIPSERFDVTPTLSSRSNGRGEDDGWRVAVGYELTLGDTKSAELWSRMEFKANKAWYQR